MNLSYLVDVRLDSNSCAIPQVLFEFSFIGTNSTSVSSTHLPSWRSISWGCSCITFDICFSSFQTWLRGVVLANEECDDFIFAIIICIIWTWSWLEYQYELQSQISSHTSIDDKIDQDCSTIADQHSIVDVNSFDVHKCEPSKFLILATPGIQQLSVSMRARWQCALRRVAWALRLHESDDPVSSFYSSLVIWIAARPALGRCRRWRIGIRNACVLACLSDALCLLFLSVGGGAWGGHTFVVAFALFMFICIYIYIYIYL